jgi:hypothetical protein
MVAQDGVSRKPPPRRLPHRLGPRAVVLSVTVCVLAACWVVDYAGAWFVEVPAWLDYVAIMVWLVFSVLTVRWLYDARVNLNYVRGATPRWRPGWAIASWFIPVAGWLIQGAMLADVGRNTVPSTDPAGRRRLVTRTWWCYGCFLLSSLLDAANWIARDLTNSAVLAVALGLPSKVLALVYAALFVAVVREVSLRQDACRAPDLAVVDAALDH